MSRANDSQYLIKFSERLEEKEVVSAESAGKIRKYIRSEESPTFWKLFIVIAASLGAITLSAGVFAITSHNWYDMPVWLRGALSFVPTGIALFFYYRMLTKHPNSTAWIESTSLFLMLMIGATIAINSQTYHMGGDYEDFIFTMLLTTIPLFYIKRASIIAYFYLSLSITYLFLDFRFSIRGDSIFQFGSNSVWFWLFILAFLPHYIMSLDRTKKVQGLRFLFLTFLLYGTILQALIFSIESNRLLWILVYNVGVYLLAKRYMGNHHWFWWRIMSWIPQLVIALALLAVSNRFVMMGAFEFDSFFNMDDWTGGQWYYFLLLLVVMGGVYFNFFRNKDHFEDVNHMIVFSPGLIIFLMLLYEVFDTWWLLSLFINGYILGVAIVTMVNGAESGKFWKLLAGLLLYGLLVLVRYLDTDMGFIWKGLLFLVFGGIFILIAMFMKERVDQISRNKKRSHGK